VPDSSARDALAAEGGYDPAYYRHLADAEDEHFWFAARLTVIEQAIAPIVAAFEPEYRVLEIGCGTGQVLRLLERVCTAGRVVGMDLFHEGLLYARRGCRCGVVQASSDAPPFSTRFDLVGLFDVLEHLPQDGAFLERTRELLTPRGALLLTVPAHPSLWSGFDEQSHHCRRYEPRHLDRLLEDAGFRVEYLTPFMAASFPLVWASRRFAGHRADRDHVRAELRIRPLVNPVLRWILEREARLIVPRRWRLPFGTSLLAIARPAAT
jgi:SAM-dependent methyltransferase